MVFDQRRDPPNSDPDRRQLIATVVNPIPPHPKGPRSRCGGVECVGRMQYGSSSGIRDMCSWGIPSCSGEIHVGIQPYLNMYGHMFRSLSISLYMTPDSNTGASWWWRWRLLLNQYTLANTLPLAILGLAWPDTHSHILETQWPRCDIWNLFVLLFQVAWWWKGHLNICKRDLGLSVLSVSNTFF